MKKKRSAKRVAKRKALAPREVCFVLDARGKILWSDASTTAYAIPDSRARWEAIWKHRLELVEIAHSHPHGPMAFSHEDETTMEALVAALGRAPRFSVVAPNGMIVREDGRDRRLARDEEPRWAMQLRRRSGIQ